MPVLLEIRKKLQSIESRDGGYISREALSHFENVKSSPEIDMFETLNVSIKRISI